MRFPQELVDEILNHLPSDDKQDKRTLRNCSLVAKSWVSPSRRHLFESVLINKANRQLWLDGISPANVELLWHVRSLDCSGTDPQQVIAPPPTHADIGDLYVYLPSFRRLQTITLFHISVAPDLSERMEMFSSCQSVLSSLILCAISLPWRSFIALIDYFPNLRNLELESLSFADDNTNPSPLSRPPRGKLCFHLCQEDYLVAFSDWFAGLDVEYDELVVDVGYVTGRYSQRIVTTCEGSLKRLKFQLLGTPTSLHHCSKLCELEFSVLYPTDKHQATISSITSLDIRRITFSSYFSANLTPRAFTANACWPPLDKCMSTLIGKLRRKGYKQILEVEFRCMSVAGNQTADYKGFLPMFREKGRVRIVDRSTGRVLELA